MKTLGKVIGYVTLVAIMVILGSFTVQTLWGWFIVPLGAKAIGMAHAYGLMVIAMYLKFKNIKREKKVDDYSFAEKCFCGIGFMGMTLLIGYITTLFM